MRWVSWASPGRRKIDDPSAGIRPAEGRPQSSLLVWWRANLCRHRWPRNGILRTLAHRLMGKPWREREIGMCRSGRRCAQLRKPDEQAGVRAVDSTRPWADTRRRRSQRRHVKRCQHDLGATKAEYDQHTSPTCSTAHGASGVSQDAGGDCNTGAPRITRVPRVALDFCFITAASTPGVFA